MLKKGLGKKGIVRKYLDQFDDLKDLEGIYNYSTNDPKVTSSYKFLILFDENDFVYKGFIMDARCVGCQHWRKGERKVILEESAMEGEFTYRWYQPGRRNRKGRKKKPDTYISGEAYEKYGGIEITLQFSNGYPVYLIKKYPK